MILTQYPTLVLNSKIPHQIYDDLLVLTDYIYKYKKKELDYSYALAGKIKRGAQLMIPKDPEFPLTKERSHYFKYLEGIIQQYIILAKTYNNFKGSDVKEPSLVLDDTWCIYQKSGDFNPLHGHDGFISGVIFIEIPSTIMNSKSKDDGYLFFERSDPRLDSSNKNSFLSYLTDSQENSVQVNTEKIKPIPREIWVFPSWQLHRVSEFKSKKERRSVSFNFMVNF